MAQTRAQKARQQAQNTPVEPEQRPGQQLEQETGEQSGQRSAPRSRGSDTASLCDTPVVQNVRGQQSTIDKAHNPVQATRLRIGTMEVEDAIETVDNSNPITLWIKEGRWTGNKYLGSDMEPLTDSEYSESLSGRRRRDTGTPVTRSSAKSQEQSVPYKSPRYEMRLNVKYCFLGESDLGVAEESKVLCRSLLELKQIYPEKSLLGDHVFAKTLEKLQGRNEVHIIRKIGHLIVPSAKDFAIEGAKHLDILEETFYEGWNNSIPLTGARPQPDYSVGFNKAAFTSLQLTRLSPFVLGIPGGSTDRSYFMATNEMFFPFLACEVKSEKGALITAGRQNAHSMTLAVRGILALFRLVRRDHELNREILAFSISHDSEMALIYGHYGTIDEDGKVRYYRHKIANFDFLAHDGRDRWKAYQFTKNVYDVWMPKHLGRIRAVIDQLSDDRDFEVSKLSGSTSLPQNLQAMAGSEGEGEVTASLPVDTGYESNQGREGDIPTASPTTPSPCKKQKTSASQS